MDGPRLEAHMEDCSIAWARDKKEFCPIFVFFRGTLNLMLRVPCTLNRVIRV